MTSAKEFVEKFKAFDYWEYPIGTNDLRRLDRFMLKNEVGPFELAFLSEREAEWSNTTLDEVKTQLDQFKIPSKLWFSKEGQEKILVFIVHWTAKS